MQLDKTAKTPTIRSSRRRALDVRLGRHEERVGRVPPIGWIRPIREALGMSQYELGQRMGVSQPRVAQLERAEASGSIQLSTMRNAAAALGCSLWYVLVPDEPLELMVQRQALHVAGGLPGLAEELVDKPGLWRAVRPAAETPPLPTRPWPPPEEGA